MFFCVSDSTLPSSPNLTTILTPQESDKKPKPAAAEEPIETALKPSNPPEPKPESEPQQTTTNPVVETALAPKATETTPAQKAVEKVSETPKTEPDQPVAKATTTEAKLAEKQAEEQLRPKPSAVTTKPKPSNTFFSNLFKSNTANKVTPSRSEDRTIVRNNRARPRVRVRRNSGNSALPGVRLKSLFGIDTDDTEEFDQPVKIASVTNRARRGTHGLLLQRKGVQVGCFPPKLLRLLRQVERRFGRTPIVTSGYRSAAYNRRIRGARKSLHIFCKAADIQVQGVSKWRLAKYLRSLPGRGGVGTYCHTKSVHIDIGNKRDWNRRCRRSRARRRR